MCISGRIVRRNDWIAPLDDERFAMDLEIAPTRPSMIVVVRNFVGIIG